MQPRTSYASAITRIYSSAMAPAVAGLMHTKGQPADAATGFICTGASGGGGSLAEGGSFKKRAEAS